MRPHVITDNGHQSEPFGAVPRDRTPDAWRFRCPTCGTALRPSSADRMVCDGEQHAFSRADGIWRCLPERRVAELAAFMRDYQTVRKSEGRHSTSADYYQALPFHDLTGRYEDDWRIRAVSYRALVDLIVKPLEARHGRPLNVLDLGAGNCWLSNRLAERGHNLAAIDLQTNADDGLGAHRYYRTAFTPIQAEFDALPLGSLQADLAIFNGSAHYSTDLVATLTEVLRVLRPDGVLVILDSPVYQDAASGAQMVREREERFTSEFGFPSNALPMENFLTYRRLDEIAAQVGLQWQIHQPFYGLRWALRPWKARVKRHREPARFLLIAGYQDCAQPVARRRARRTASRLVLRLLRPARTRKLKRVVLEEVAGWPIVVLPEVFNPRLFRSGEFFASQLSQRLVRPGCTVLDLGTGTGIGAIAAARWARSVTAVDINPVAVRCATINTMVNQVDDRVTVLHGDLFEPVPDERFDLILFNPPFYRGTPRSLMDLAWRSEDVVSRFAREVSDHLEANGAALVILSTDGEEERFLEEFSANDLNVQPLVRRDLTNEVFTVYRLTDRGTEHDHSV
jgi:methylase of polypeptide subunit release factors